MKLCAGLSLSETETEGEELGIGVTDNVDASGQLQRRDRARSQSPEALSDACKRVRGRPMKSTVGLTCE